MNRYRSRNAVWMFVAALTLARTIYGKNEIQVMLSALVHAWCSKCMIWPWIPKTSFSTATVSTIMDIDFSCPHFLLKPCWTLISTSSYSLPCFKRKADILYIGHTLFHMQVIRISKSAQLMPLVMENFGKRYISGVVFWSILSCDELYTALP